MLSLRELRVLFYNLQLSCWHHSPLVSPASVNQTDSMQLSRISEQKALRVVMETETHQIP